MYHKLNADSILATLERLRDRIRERFPQRGVTRVCDELLDVARRSTAEAARLTRPDWRIRAGVAATIALGGAGSLFLFGLILGMDRGADDMSGFVQGLEAFFNIVVLSSLAVAFLITIEQRHKRRRALRALYELRSLSHVIDMHQLAKAPNVALGVILARPTPSSPKRDLSPAELIRYLDYCTEMLAIIGKLAALYAQNLRDPVTIATVNEIEELTSDLSRKIWQKLIIMHRDVGEADGVAGDLVKVLTKTER